MSKCFTTYFLRKLYIAKKKKAHYLITLNLDSQKAGSYKCLLVTDFFCCCSISQIERRLFEDPKSVLPHMVWNRIHLNFI